MRAKKPREGVRFVVKPNLAGTNAWLAVSDGLLPPGTRAPGRDLAARFAGVEAWFSDLDDFDTRSPAKLIALRAVGTRHLDPAYARWAIDTMLLICRYGRKRAEAMSWKRYYDAFLKRDAEGDWLKDEAFSFIDALLTPEGVARLLYPSVREFYERLGAVKYLVTRNLERIAYRYSRVLPYEGYYCEVRDKAAVIESFVAAHPGVRSYGLGGDSAEDAAAAAVLARLHREGRIEEPICLYRAASPRELDPAFNVFVGKDRSALASLLG